MKYRFIVPGIFLLLVILFSAVYIAGTGGHGPNPFDFVGYLLFPACLLTGFLDSILGGPGLLWLVLCALASLLQYFLIGYAIDKLLAWRRKPKATDNSL